MKKIYVKPDAETLDFSVEDVLMDDIIDASIGVGPGQFPEDGD